MRHGFHHAKIRVEGGLRQILAIACGGDGRHIQARMVFIQPQQHRLQQRNGVALIGPVIGEEQVGILIDHRHLHGGGARVDPDMDRLGIVRREVCLRHRRLGVTGLERVVFRLIFKQRRLGAVGLRHSALLQQLRRFLKIPGLLRVECRAQRHEQQAVFRAGPGDAQRLVKALPQALGEGQRPAQIQDVAFDGASLSQSRNGLVHNRLINAFGNVGGLSPLIDEGLNIALGKHAAA